MRLDGVQSSDRNQTSRNRRPLAPETGRFPSTGIFSFFFLPTYSTFTVMHDSTAPDPLFSVSPWQPAHSRHPSVMSFIRCVHEVCRVKKQREPLRPRSKSSAQGISVHVHVHAHVSRQRRSETDVKKLSQAARASPRAHRDASRRVRAHV